MKFPPREDSKDLNEIYSRLDEWDQMLASSMKFEAIERKFLFRRVSSRYISMILSHCTLLAELIRSSEETDVAYNNEVISFSLKLHRGNFPG
jgi:hypothetical protein